MIIFDVELTGIEVLALFCGSGMWIVFNFVILNWVKIKNIERDPMYLYKGRAWEVDIIILTLQLSMFWWTIFECFEVMKKFI